MKVSRILAVLAVLLIAASCASKPEPKPEPVITEPVVTEPAIAKADVQALHEKVLAARKDAFDQGAKDLYPEEYAAAETRYTAGKGALDQDKLAMAQTELTAALPLYQELGDKSARSGADKGKTDAQAARQRALDSKADAYSSQELKAADDFLAKAEAAYAAGDYRAAREAYAKAAQAFDAADKHAQASAVKARVDALAFGPMDQGNYQLAGEKLALAQEKISTQPSNAADAAAEALLRYNLVLAKGWELSAGQRKAEVEKVKTDSEAIKAQVAVKDAYAEAVTAYQNAEYAYTAGKFEESVALYAKAKQLFDAVYRQAADKRAAAEAAIRAAQQSAEQSANVAQMGDMTLGNETQPQEAGE